MVEKKSNSSTVTGLPENTEAALCYVLGWLTGLVFLLANKNSKKVRFHAMQSLVTFGALHLLTIILSMFLLPMLFMSRGSIAFLFPVINIAIFVLWLFLIIKAYQGEDFVVPVLGEFAKKQLK